MMSASAMTLRRNSATSRLIMGSSSTTRICSESKPDEIDSFDVLPLCEDAFAAADALTACGVPAPATTGSSTRVRQCGQTFHSGFTSCLHCAQIFLRPCPQYGQARKLASITFLHSGQFNAATALSTASDRNASDESWPMQ